MDLTDGKSNLMDLKGLFSVNNRGEWGVKCLSKIEADDSLQLAEYVCRRKDFPTFKFSNLTTISKNDADNIFDIKLPSNHTGECSILYVECASYVQKQFKNFSAPWNADIFINGDPACNGILVDRFWIAAESGCLNRTK